MNRRDFIRYLSGTAAAASVFPQGLIYDNTVMRLPQQWAHIEHVAAVAMMDPKGRIICAQRLKGLTMEPDGDKGIRVDAPGVVWDSRMLNFRGKPEVEVAQILVSVHIPDFGREEFGIGVNHHGPMMLPNYPGDVGITFAPEGIAHILSPSS